MAKRIPTFRPPSMTATQAARRQTIGGILLGVGVAAIGTGVILVPDVRPSSSSAQTGGISVAKNTSVTPAVSPNSRGFARRAF